MVSEAEIRDFIAEKLKQGICPDVEEVLYEMMFECDIDMEPRKVEVEGHLFQTNHKFGAIFASNKVSGADAIDLPDMLTDTFGGTSGWGGATGKKFKITLEEVL